ncbi:flagellar filament capping protein FliD, partial [Phycisphaerales bacterium AB-hyl4]
YKALSQVGITVGDGAKLTLDEERLNSALQNDRGAVEELFTLRQTEENEEGEREVIARGLGAELEDLLDRLTHPEYGPVESRLNTLDSQSTMNERRMESMQESIAAKQERLEREFLAMEMALGQMQGQMDALMGMQQSIGANSGPPQMPT